MMLVEQDLRQVGEYMAVCKIVSKGSYSKFEQYLNHLREKIRIKDLDKYGQEGVALLSEKTPKDTGLTANSWYYTIVRKDGTVNINFLNRNIQNGVPIAIILQYGHATGNGGYVEGTDYINPIIIPLFQKIADDAWKEVVRL